MLQYPQPNITVAYGLTFIAMRLQFYWASFVFAVRGLAYVWGIAQQNRIVLYKHTIMKNGYMCKGLNDTMIVKPGGRPDNLEGLPLAGLF